MCGISGLVNCGDKETLAHMTSVQAHRGPDDSGLLEQRCRDGSYAGLGRRRPAIIDLAASGHMPMCNEDRTVWITYNGEIYNFAELRREQRQRGWFRPAAVRAFVDEHRRGVQDWSIQIWQFRTLELWMQTFLDGGAKRTVTNLTHIPQAATA